MRPILKNPFFLAIVASGAVATACALLTLIYTDAGQAFFMGGFFLICTLIPAITIALLAYAVMKENARLRTEQAAEPREALRKRYKDQMVISLAGPVAEGLAITFVLFLAGENSAERIMLAFGLLLLIFSPYFFQGLLGWWRNRPE